MITDILNFQTKFNVRIEGELWVFELLRPLEKMKRSSLISSYLEDTPLQNVSSDDYNMAFVMATLQLSYREGPDWFKKDNDSKIGNIIDEDYIIELHEEYLKKDKEFKEAKKKSRRDGSRKGRKVDSSKSPIPEI